MSRRNGRISLNRRPCSLLPMNTIGPSDEIRRRIARPSVDLAGAGFADHAERLALAQLDADAVAGLDVADHLAHHAALDRKPDLEIARFPAPPARRVAAAPDRASARRRAAPACRDARARRTRARPRLARRSCRPSSRRRGRAILRTMPRSWVMNRSDMPSRFWMSFNSAMICACTVTSSAVVGSSAIEQIGLVGERHGDHHALALAAGELMRIALEPALRIGNADLGQHLDGARARRGAGQAAMQQQNLADLLLDRVQRIERGHRLLEHDGDVVAAHLPHLAFAERRDPALEHRSRPTDGAPPDRAGASGSTAPSPICRSRIRRPAPRSRPWRYRTRRGRPRASPGRR